MSRSGALKHTLELWRKTVAKNSYGENQETWELYKQIRAYVHRRSGSEEVTNDEVFDVIRLNITVRNQVDVQEMDRIKYFGKMYIIEFIQPDDTGRWLNLRCTKLNE